MLDYMEITEMASTNPSTTSATATLSFQSCLPHLRVTTWNLLAPVVDASKMFPGVADSITDQAVRRSIIQRRLASMDSDVLLLQEVRPQELRAILQEGEAPLGEKYEHHIALEKRGRLSPATKDIEEQRPAQDQQNESDVMQHAQNEAIPRALGYGAVVSPVGSLIRDDASEAPSHQSSTVEFGDREQRRGVAILWRKALLSNVRKFEERVGNPLNPAAMVQGFLACLDTEVLFASKHLDALGLPPSVAGAESELLAVADALVQEVGPERVAIVYGGDCNLTTRSPAFKDVHQRGFCIASERLGIPTCFSVICSSRLDHIFTRGPLTARDTDIPECQYKHCCVLVPFFHHIQVMTDIVSQAFVRRKQISCCRCILGYLLFLPLILTVIFVFFIPLPLSLRRCRWSLQEYGSDHLPVTITLLKSPTSSHIQA